MGSAGLLGGHPRPLSLRRDTNECIIYDEMSVSVSFLNTFFPLLSPIAVNALTALSSVQVLEPESTLFKDSLTLNHSKNSMR